MVTMYTVANFGIYTKPAISVSASNFHCTTRRWLSNYKVLPTARRTLPSAICCGGTYLIEFPNGSERDLKLVAEDASGKDGVSAKTSGGSNKIKSQIAFVDALIYSPFLTEQQSSHFNGLIDLLTIHDDLSNSIFREERIYLGGFEIYREYSGSGEHQLAILSLYESAVQPLRRHNMPCLHRPGRPAATGLRSPRPSRLGAASRSCCHEHRGCTVPCG